MNILAIETSCDDTSVAVLNVSGKKYPKFKILSNIISSQINIHKKWGGVFPSLAKREHQKNLPIVLKRVLSKNKKIDLIAVTQGPGLEPCLWVGINFANDLVKKINKPIMPVNHVEAHIMANFLKKLPPFPAICLVVSGGHTQLVLMKGPGKYQILGETRDDAAGECFDKVARILGLGYPGGPIVSKLASKFKNKDKTIKLPRPMISQKNYDFSFSGLKTAVLYNFQSQPEKIRKSKEYIREMCSESQQSIIDVLVSKTMKAALDYRTKSIILGGGVTANKELREQFRIRSQKSKINLFVPEKKLCTDNAVMIAVTAYYNLLKNPNKKYGDIEADANFALK